MDSADSSVDFEKQVCYGFSWQNITDHELRNDVKSRLLQENESQIDVRIVPGRGRTN